MRDVKRTFSYSNTTPLLLNYNGPSPAYILSYLKVFLGGVRDLLRFFIFLRIYKNTHMFQSFTNHNSATVLNGGCPYRHLKQQLELVPHAQYRSTPNRRFKRR
jgi:hypothetical protein